MKIEIDGVERQLLLKLLATCIEGGSSASLCNCIGMPAALSLFRRLQPTGRPSAAEPGDFVESPDDGMQFEVVVSGDGTAESPFLAEQVSADNGHDHRAKWLDDLHGAIWPKAITVQEALRSAVPWHVNPARPEAC